MTDAATIKSGSVRVFIQEDGTNPAAPYNYYGCVMLDSPNQDLGAPDPVYCPSSTQRNKWDIIDDIPKTPSLGSADFTAHAEVTLREIWWDLKRRGCKFNMQAVIGTCQRPDDFHKWDSKLVFMGTRLTNLGMSGLNALAGDENAVVDFTGSLSFQDWEPVRPIKFGEKGDATILAEIVDGFYFDVAQCGECGVPSDGCNAFYALAVANSGSPGLSGQLAYSLNRGGVVGTVDIPTLGGLSANRTAPMGDKVIVVSQATNSHHYSPIASINAGTVDWTEVETGYVATKGPRAIYVKSPNQAFLAAAGGYIYTLSGPTVAAAVLTDGSISTQDQNDIHGSGQVIVSVGGSNSILYSENGGDSFSLVTGPAAGVNLTAVWCLSSTVWLVGTGAGKLYYTLNSGTSWTEISVTAGISVINDIRFENDVIGYMSVEIGGAGRVYRTTDSGNTWHFASPHIHSLPTNQRVNFVYPCGINRVLVGGRKTVGGDGMLAIAE